MTRPKRARRRQPIDFGRYRRSYILDRDVVLDHRSGRTIRGAKRVLDGDLEVTR